MAYQELVTDLVDSKDATKLTYFVVFVFLCGSTLLTVLEVIYATRPPKNPTFSYLQSGLMIESAVNCIAGYFYYILTNKALDGGISVKALGDFSENFRSIDWLLTTPLMIASLLYYYMYNDECCQTTLCSQLKMPKRDYSVPTILGLVVVMIVAGSPLLVSLAPTNRQGTVQLLGYTLSWAAFGGLVWLIYDNFYKQSKTKYKDIVTWLFLVVWSLYGVTRTYELASGAKAQKTYNFLDVVSKGGFGLLLWFVVQNVQAGNCE